MAGTGQSERVWVGLQPPRVYVRVEGWATLKSAPALQAFAAKARAAGGRQFLFDLRGCAGMDSTFTGTVAGIGLEVQHDPQGGLRLAGVSGRLAAALRLLGIDRLAQLQVEEGGAADGAWGLPESALSPLGGSETEAVSARGVLEAHRNLAALSEENRRRFEGVISCLEAEAGTPPPAPEKT